MLLLRKLFQIVVKIFFSIFFRFVKIEQRLDEDFKKTIELYQGDGFGELFVKIRAWDAPYAEVEKLIPSSALVLDLGCGDGLLSNYLAISSSERKIVGIELNKERIKKADKGLKNTRFIRKDILSLKLPEVEVILLIHVLHHLSSRKCQEILLKRIAESLHGEQKLVILEVDKKPLLKFLFSWITDAIIVSILFERKLFTANFFYRKTSEWRKLLENLGFHVRARKIHKGMPFSHVLIVAAKEQ